MVVNGITAMHEQEVIVRVEMGIRSRVTRATDGDGILCRLLERCRWLIVEQRTDARYHLQEVPAARSHWTDGGSVRCEGCDAACGGGGKRTSIRDPRRMPDLLAYAIGCGPTLRDVEMGQRCPPTGPRGASAHGPRQVSSCHYV